MKKLLNNYRFQYTSIIRCMMISKYDREFIFSATSSKEITKNMVKAKPSSNIWSYGINVKTAKDPVGDVVIQFKGKDGGPDDIYIYYDVPVNIYKKFISSPSLGHAFWKFIRNNYKYSKLTGDKRTKLKNGVN